MKGSAGVSEHVILLVEPVDSIRFADAVRQLGLYWLVLNQLPPMSA
jgi:hypothetical protein